MDKILEKNTWNLTRTPGAEQSFVIVDMYMFIVTAFL